MKGDKSLLLPIMAVILMMWGSSVQARDYTVNELISLSVGESQQREFLVYDVLDPAEREPVEAFIALAIGSEEEPAGTLSIGLSADPELAFGGYMDFALLGFGFSLDAGQVVISESATTPFSIETSFDVDSIFGFVYVGAYISSISSSRRVDLPAPFTITFALAAQEIEAPPVEE